MIELTPAGISRADVVLIARHQAPIRFGSEAHRAVMATSQVVERILERGESVYGVTTGFGSLADTPIPSKRSAELQVSLVRSHAAGMGPEVETEVARGMMGLRARSLALGFSGVRPIVIETMVAILNAGITPVVYEYGSLGASGDLAPLAHCALAVIGEGEVINPTGRRVPAAEALAAADIEPVTLRAKEGLALINGTDGMLAMLVLALDDLDHLTKLADVIAAMTVEGLLGTDRVFAADLQDLRPQLGQANSAANLRRVLDGSTIVASHTHGDSRVQDAYSLRCTPSVHGAVRDSVSHAIQIADRELRAAIDNPMILPDGRVESCGNFHGAPLAHAADFLSITVADLGALSERRTDRMLDVKRSHGLPAFLAADPGVDSGLMIAHYTQAAMVAENRRQANPASPDSIPTSAMQEDHVSLGWAAARKLRLAVSNLERILSVELMAAARAIELRQPISPSPATKAAIEALRSVVSGVGPDRWLAPELAATHQLVHDRTVLDSVEDAIGPLE